MGRGEDDGEEVGRAGREGAEVLCGESVAAEQGRMARIGFRLGLAGLGRGRRPWRQKHLLHDPHLGDVSYIFGQNPAFHWPFAQWGGSQLKTPLAFVRL